MSSTASEFLGDSIATFRRYQDLGARAMAQIPDEELFRAPDAEGNSIAIIVKHLHGNMLSRWRDFLTTDGEKPDRDRDSEFEMNAATTGDTVRAWWDEGWQTAISGLEALRPTDLERTVTIRGEPHSVLQAIMRQVTHAAYHVGQIVLLAKHAKGGEWSTLSIAKRKAGGA
jgi:uncharacterized damage-inducible protein DinB